MKKSTASLTILIIGLLAAICSWIAGYYVMDIVYDSPTGSILFATILALIIFYEIRLMSISLRIDGKVSISKREVSGNLIQIVLATLTAVLVSVPLSMMLVESYNGVFSGCLNDRLSAFIAMVGDYWLMIGGITLFDVALFNAPIIVRLKSIDE